MDSKPLLDRITADPKVCSGKPCIKGTRIYISIILDALAEGLSPELIISDHYPHLVLDDIRACVAYASELAREEVCRKPSKKSWMSYAGFVQSGNPHASTQAQKI